MFQLPLKKYNMSSGQGQPPAVFYKKKVLLKILQISQKNYLCWSIFLIKLQGLRSAILLKRDSSTGIFLRN